jgi:hypothetical protein
MEIITLALNLQKKSMKNMDSKLMPPTLQRSLPFSGFPIQMKIMPNNF